MERKRMFIMIGLMAFVFVVGLFIWRNSDNQTTPVPQQPPPQQRQLPFPEEGNTPIPQPPQQESAIDEQMMFDDRNETYDQRMPMDATPNEGMSAMSKQYANLANADSTYVNL